MKSALTFAFILSVATLAFGQTTNPQLDTSLAKKLGADDYGMKMYILVAK